MVAKLKIKIASWELLNTLSATIFFYSEIFIEYIPVLCNFK